LRGAVALVLQKHFGPSVQEEPKKVPDAQRTLA
jgi:hypothetical protein